eukprot:GFYU01003530.1.p1 GENE.GFYU01003530.1~~GFYU01003530.1.p1  ORF type:complete len:320 (-),score=86.78 GFYU01003530.1:170-1129(-)
MDASLYIVGTVLVALIAVALTWFFRPLFIWHLKISEASNVAMENTYIDPNKDNERCSFPSLFSPGTIHLSVVVPAYNEEERIPDMLKETCEYFAARQKQDKSLSWELIVVDDGSVDKTCDIVLQYSRKYTTEHVRLLKLTENVGKGGAVKRGMYVARGNYMIFADADGATDIRDYEKTEKSALMCEKNGLTCAVGSRAHLQDEAVAKRKWYRNILMYGFHLMVLLCVRGIQDTQCGFKFFSRKAAQKIFTVVHLSGWCFDVEVLYIAQKLGVPISEVAVNWTEIPGSKLPITSPLSMGRDLFLIRIAYLTGLWKLSPSR